ncbi:Vesicle transport protein S20, partial [Dipsacomyces acuminosporus]
MPTDIINTLDNLTATLGHLSAEFDQVEKDIELLRQFGGSRDDFQQFSTSLRDQLRALERLSEQLSVELEDHYYDSDSQRQELQETLGKLDKRKVTLQRSFRSALLQYRINSTNSAKKERELLLSGATTPMELRKRKAKTGNAVVNTASEVTAALKDTVQLMNEEIEKSVKNITTLQDSSDRLKKTNEEHKTLESILRASKNLIKALEQADAVDRWLML